VRIATPPEETRNWVDADKVVPNTVPPQATVHGSMPAFGSHQPQDRAALGLELAPTLVALADEVIE
jgi:hypothetical protein